jgi:transcriptional regulator with XRE-family HTH domain
MRIDVLIAIKKLELGARLALYLKSEGFTEVDVAERLNTSSQYASELITHSIDEVAAILDGIPYEH